MNLTPKLLVPIVIGTALLVGATALAYHGSSPRAQGTPAPRALTGRLDRLILKAVQRLTPEAAAELSSYIIDPVYLRLLALGDAGEGEKAAVEVLKHRTALALERDYGSLIAQFAPEKQESARQLLTASQVEVFDVVQAAAENGDDLMEQGRKVRAYRTALIKKYHELLDEKEGDMLYEIVRDTPLRRDANRMASALSGPEALTAQQAAFLSYCRRMAPGSPSPASVLAHPSSINKFAEDSRTASKLFLRQAAQGISAGQYDRLASYENARVEKLLAALHELTGSR